IASLANVEVLSSISNDSNSKPIIFFVSKNKIFIYSKINKIPDTEIYSLDKIKELKMIEETKRRGSLFLKLSNDKTYELEDIKKNEIIDFLNTYETIKDSFEDNSDNKFLKNIGIIDDYSDSDLLKNIQNLERIKSQTFDKDLQNFSEEKKNISRENKQVMNNPIKSKRIVDDSKISNDTTFSSKYIYSLLSKRNTLLPDGKLSRIDKLNSKIDEIDVYDTKYNDKKIDEKFVQDIKVVLHKINEKVNLLKENIENTVYEKTSSTNEKIDKVAANSVDSKEIIKLKYSIENSKNEIEKELKDFVKATNEKMQKISDNLIGDNVLQKIDDKISDYKLDLIKEVEDVKITLKDKLSSISEIADKQIRFANELKKYSNENENFNDEIYVVQKAWLENNKKFEIQNEKLIKLENSWRNQANAINVIIKKIKSKFGEEENENIKNSNVDPGWFLDSIHNERNKLLAVSDEGLGVYFDVDEFKNDIDKIITQSKNELNLIFDEKIHDLKKFVISNVENESNKKDDIIIEKALSEKENQIVQFKAKSYILNGIERHGIRSGQTLSLKMDKNVSGIDTLYFSEDKKEPLHINRFDGIIFANRKYYLNVPKEFSLDKKYSLTINHIEYTDSFKPFRSYVINIDNTLFEYKVFDERGFLLSDKDAISSKYDLKWLSFFKD
ncbi:MAG: coiled-coil domain-containing protein, partial [Mycoplasmoidaceae bacterium]